MEARPRTPGTPVTTTVNMCVDDRTTCLTREHGWAYHHQLSAGDHVLSYDPHSHTTQWQPLLDLAANEHYDGDMHHLSAPDLSALATPDHRWPLQRPATGVRTVQTSRALPHSNDWALMRNAPHAGPRDATYSDAFVRLLAWYTTTGTLLRTGTALSLRQPDTANPRHVDAIRRDLAGMGGLTVSDAPHHHPLVTSETRRRDGLATWLLTGSDVHRILTAAPGTPRVPTMCFLTHLTPQQAALFVDTCVMANGSAQHDSIQQPHPGRMNALLTAAVLAGHALTLDPSGTRCRLRRNPSPDHTDTHIATHTLKRETVRHQGTIWCPHVPSGHWVARRAGTVYLTGSRCASAHQEYAKATPLADTRTRTRTRTREDITAQTDATTTDTPTN